MTRTNAIYVVITDNEANIPIVAPTSLDSNEPSPLGKPSSGPETAKRMIRYFTAPRAGQELIQHHSTHLTTLEFGRTS